MAEQEYRFVDTGNAPEFFANGLHNVEVMGSVARFVLYVLRPNGGGQLMAEPPFTCVMPIEGIGSAIALTICRCPGLVLPTLRGTARAVLSH